MWMFEVVVVVSDGGGGVRVGLHLPEGSGPAPPTALKTKD